MVLRVDGNAATVEMLARLAARARRAVGVHVTVWGWGDAELDRASRLLDRLRAVAVELYRYGTETAEMEDEILQAADGAFRDADCTLREDGDLDLILLPDGLADEGA